MHVVAGEAAEEDKERPGTRLRPPGEQPPSALFSRCANPGCRTGWMRLWRSRRSPGFAGGWACSPQCMGELVAAALRRETDSSGALPQVYPHRMPMGLMLVEQGRLSAEQLRAALDGQQRTRAATGEQIRLGAWLAQSGVLSEPVLAHALSAQWSCPVFRLDRCHPAEVAAALPRFLSEALGALPVRLAANRLLYVAFSGSVDRSLCYAIERIAGVRVAAGMACDSEFRREQARFLETPGPPARFLEAANLQVLARAMTRLIETEKPVEARLARVHDWCWLRIWRRAPGASDLAAPEVVEDALCMLAPGLGKSQ